MRFYIGLGSNLGDRQANVLTALQRLRSQVRVIRVSSFYESPAAEGAEGPPFLNAAAELESALDRESFERFAGEVEAAVGRADSRRLAARPIDIDLLAADEFVHPKLASRPYNLIPLAEIAPDFRDPQTHQTMRQLAETSSNGVRRRARALHFSSDRQEEMPQVRLSLNRAGVARLRRIIRLNVGSQERVFNAEFSIVADLAPDKAGVHMSRFSETLEEATLEVLSRAPVPDRIDRLVESIGAEVVRSHPAVRAEVNLRAEFGLERWTPVSGKREEETYTLVGVAHADSRGVRHAIGIEAEGMTACPCAQGMVREHSLHDLQEAGFSEQDAQRVLDVLPGATHNQRGRGSVLVGTIGDAVQLRVEDLVEIVEGSMSSETYDLLKRPDEFFVVNKAHRNPKFVEDVVRDILAKALEMYSDLEDGSFVAALQTNFESIHKHDAFAEASGTFGEFREELRTGKHLTRKTDLASWLAAR